MTFESLCKIADGESLNTPSVNAYEKIETKAHLVKRGDLFVGSEKEAIAKALENGAYGILHESDTIMIDEEVAWIKVASTDDALIKILRFSLLKSDSLFFYFPDIEYEILKQIIKKEKVIFLKDEVHKNFKKILEAENSSFFISKKEDFLHKIYPEFITYHDKNKSLIQLTHQTLFLSSFTYEEIHYENIKLPALFLSSLNRVLHFAKESQLSFDIEKLAFIEEFKPLFISNKLTPKAFGDSEHAFIVQNNAKQILPALNYIQEFAKWANILLFIPKETNITTKIETNYYENLEEVKEIEVDKFNFILIVANYNAVSSILEKNKHRESISLFRSTE